MKLNKMASIMMRSSCKTKRTKMMKRKEKKKTMKMMTNIMKTTMKMTKNMKKNIELKKLTLNK